MRTTDHAEAGEHTDDSLIGFVGEGFGNSDARARAGSACTARGAGPIR